MRHPDEAAVKSGCTVYQASPVYWLCDRFAIERSLVLLVNCYDALLTAKPLAAAEGARQRLQGDGFKCASNRSETPRQRVLNRKTYLIGVQFSLCLVAAMNVVSQ